MWLLCKDLYVAIIFWACLRWCYQTDSLHFMTFSEVLFSKTYVVLYEVLIHSES